MHTSKADILGTLRQCDVYRVVAVFDTCDPKRCRDPESLPKYLLTKPDLALTLTLPALESIDSGIQLLITLE